MRLRVDGRLAPVSVQAALDYRRRLVGLIGRPHLAADEGLWIPACRSIHMFFMRFAIDAIFLDGDGRVLRVRAGIRPWRTATVWRARSVLELAAGAAATLGIKENSHVQIVADAAAGGGA
ncbi:DUF192 domain-containing protein [Alloalcanivorax gelatiniphagus]|uniref:DUF192 domain-containing protein n=1 Tax=Alloalcanivorax gelatiniphagus TaxID=1194167 RepID=A0ABY2XIX7_9GAMM|nr:DUF192 domain-containing protein [Alloalcanivorax gelatiniphagus]TMW11365.1 DUF192 domain-containing protein [Alloalcanivorax gelatiniphagus]